MELNMPSNGESLNLIKSNTNFPVVIVGALAGGLTAFKKFLQAIPEDFWDGYRLAAPFY